jgi:hypothetical protein
VKVHDPGHVYELENLDDPDNKFPRVVLCFVKREGDGYPGNVGSHPGTNIQEVLRALIDRVHYLNNQVADTSNLMVIDDLRHALRALELRAARRHSRQPPEFQFDLETQPFCSHCGHIGCSTQH